MLDDIWNIFVAIALIGLFFMIIRIIKIVDDMRIDIDNLQIGYGSDFQIEPEFESQEITTTRASQKRQEKFSDRLEIGEKRRNPNRPGGR